MFLTFKHMETVHEKLKLLRNVFTDAVKCKKKTVEKQIHINQIIPCLAGI